MKKNKNEYTDDYTNEDIKKWENKIITYYRVMHNIFIRNLPIDIRTYTLNDLSSGVDECRALIKKARKKHETEEILKRIKVTKHLNPKRAMKEVIEMFKKVDISNN
jgi:hypothetical protein